MSAQPLAGIKIIDLTRVLAGPISAQMTDAVRAVAAYQKSRGLPKTGTLDWNTALSLPETGGHFLAMTPGNSL
ncbi:MAG: hypothetical protein KGL35_27860 [Bradyrhizobium sp.]|nr:hypothetical protein [Bradyrhizobium sp.]